MICTAFGCWENGREKGTHLFLGLLRRMCVFCIQICSLNLVDVAGHTKWRMGTVVRRFDAIVGGNSSISGEQSLARCWIVLLLLKLVSSLLQWLKIRSEWGEIYVCFSIAWSSSLYLLADNLMVKSRKFKCYNFRCTDVCYTTGTTVWLGFPIGQNLKGSDY